MTELFAPATGSLPIQPIAELSPAQRQRYARHLSIPGFTELAQRRMLGARVCVVGTGGLGSPVLLYLAGAGVGTIGIVDDDIVDATNLQRQVIHDNTKVGMPKAASAAERVMGLNPGVVVRPFEQRLTAENAAALIADYDLVIDATDNFATRYQLHDACAAAGIPVVWGALLSTRAQVSVFWRTPAGGIGLRDLFPDEPPPSAAATALEVGVFGPLCGQVGSLMAGEAIKLISGVGEPLLGQVMLIDAMAGTCTRIPLRAAAPQ